ncbi:MAG: hypothetical protein VB108_03635 [Anaerolineaceae bacterium]|nr:hypothetical protein [Anaerolineaceae bacterium]
MKDGNQNNTISKKSLLLQKINWKNVLIVFLLCAVLSFPVYYTRITQPVEGDFGSHVRHAEEFLKYGFFQPVPRSHPLLQYLMLGISKLSGGLFGLYASLLIIQVFIQGLTGSIIYLWLGNAKNKGWEYWRVAASVSVTFLAPIMFLAFKDSFFYYGYIGLANYHNPTIHLLKPIALLCLILALKGFECSKNPWWVSLISAVLVILSSLVKPNFILAFVPALGLISLYELFRRQVLDLRLMIFGFALPSVAVLIWQWFITYQSGDYSNSIAIAPFAVESAFSQFLLAKFLLSTLFVWQGLFIFRHDLLKDQTLLLGWVTFLIGILQNYFLIEKGSEMLSGNFRWSGQIVLFCMVVILLRKSLRFFIADGLGKAWQKAMGLATYLAHLLAGLAYYIYCITSIHYR